VGIGAGVEHDSIHRKAHFMYFINDGSFVITLEIGQSRILVGLTERFKIRLEITVSIDTLFPYSQQIQVRTIDDDDITHKFAIS